MAQQSNQPISRTASTDHSQAGHADTESPVQATRGKVVTLPFTVRELVDTFMNLQTADEREAFWADLDLQMHALSEDQKALFVLSWHESLQETLAGVDRTLLKD